MPRISNNDITKVMTERLGIIALMAKDLGISRQALSRRIASNRALKAALDDIRQTTIDLLEAALLRAALNGDHATAKWLLERLGKERGFTLRTEHTGRNGGPIDLNTLTEGLSNDGLEALERLIATGSDSSE